MTDDIQNGCSPETEPIYVASRASIPARSAMWRELRDKGWKITSSWIDEAGEGETADFTELWDRITREIAASTKLVLYAEAADFPLKGAILEAGIALGMGKPVIVCLPGVELEGRTKRPIGSWIEHRNVIRCDWLPDAMSYHNFERRGAAQQPSLTDGAQMKDVIDWVDSWVSNPVGSYSVAALDGLFATTRDKIAALAPGQAGAGEAEPLGIRRCDLCEYERQGACTKPNCPLAAPFPATQGD